MPPGEREARVSGNGGAEGLREGRVKVSRGDKVSSFENQ